MRQDQWHFRLVADGYRWAVHTAVHPTRNTEIDFVVEIPSEDELPRPNEARVTKDNKPVRTKHERS